MIFEQIFELSQKTGLSVDMAMNLILGIVFGMAFMSGLLNGVVLGFTCDLVQKLFSFAKKAYKDRNKPRDEQET